MKNHFIKGFTLIELLVVISIIGLLSSIAFASLGAARVKAADAAVMGDMFGMRTTTALQYETLGGSYNKTGVTISNTNCSNSYDAGTVLADKRLHDAIDNITSVNGNQPVGCVIPKDGQTCYFVAPLKTPNKTVYYECGLASIGVGASDTPDKPYDLSVGQDPSISGKFLPRLRGYITGPTEIHLEIFNTLNGTPYDMMIYNVQTAVPGQLTYIDYQTGSQVYYYITPGTTAYFRAYFLTNGKKSEYTNLFPLLVH